MLKLRPDCTPNKTLSVLCIGAHSDDIEIGCGGTILTWLKTMPAIDIAWVVLSATPDRENEAKKSARALLQMARQREIVSSNFRDGFFPAEYADIKEYFEGLKGRFSPDVIFTHWLEDRHQDHRIAAELTWNTWRNHLIFEYEIAKFEGDLQPTNTYVEIPHRIASRKVAHLDRHFGTQRNKDWFNAENFFALMRLRGLECRAASGFAEAFHARKLVL